MECWLDWIECFLLTIVLSVFYVISNFWFIILWVIIIRLIWHSYKDKTQNLIWDKAPLVSKIFNKIYAILRYMLVIIFVIFIIWLLLLIGWAVWII